MIDDTCSVGFYQCERMPTRISDFISDLKSPITFQYNYIRRLQVAMTKSSRWYRSEDALRQIPNLLDHNKIHRAYISKRSVHRQSQPLSFGQEPQLPGPQKSTISGFSLSITWQGKLAQISAMLTNTKKGRGAIYLSKHNCNHSHGMDQKSRMLRCARHEVSSSKKHSLILCW